MLKPAQKRLLEAIDHLQERAFTLDIYHRLQEDGGRPLGLGPLYSMLHRLEELGWIRSQSEPGGPARGGRPRIFWFRARTDDNPPREEDL